MLVTELLAQGQRFNGMTRNDLVCIQIGSISKIEPILLELKG